MASSTFAVSSTSDSDIEKEIDLELDACDENGIMSTTVEGEVPKDHTYTKEPDVLEDELREILDTSNQLDEMFNNVSSVNSRPSRTSRTAKIIKKAPVKPKPKKSVPATNKTVSKRNKAKQEETKKEEVPALENVTANGKVDEKSKDVVEEESKPARRGSKRKIEEKENVLEQNAEESEKELPPPKKLPARTKKSKIEKSPKKKVATDAIIDTDNLPKGWQRHIVVRKSGKTAGQCDIYYYSPDGSKFRSKPDIAAYLMRTKSNLKLDLFDFSKKKTLDAPATTQKKLPVSKPKTPSPKKPSTPKKTQKILVKIVSVKNKKKGRKGSKGAKKK